MVQHAWFLYHPGVTYKASLEDAKQCAVDIAVEIEEHELWDLCTTNLHSIVCHMFHSEDTSGPLADRKDLGIERFIGDLKAGVVNKVTQKPEKTQVCMFCVFLVCMFCVFVFCVCFVYSLCVCSVYLFSVYLLCICSVYSLLCIFYVLCVPGDAVSDDPGCH